VVRNLDSLGMHGQDHERFAAAVMKPYGAVLVTGPTGSGKSTTLYSALAVLNDGERSIITIEDPVESQIAGIKQMQVSAKAGVSFANGLRSMLRADPDVIMVGEIRDRETAQIAVEGGDRLRGGSATRPHALRSVQETGQPPGRGDRRERARRGHAVRGRGLHPLRRHRLSRTPRPLRGDAGHRGDPHDGP
jgi:energy-coupling factor transporter ATP-binding protein EcfA2